MAQPDSEYLEKWEHPDSYAGHSPTGDYVIYARNRDSTILENTNYKLILDELEALNPESLADDPPVYDFRAGHWAVGWVEYIIVKANAPANIIKAAEEIVCALADYPVYDEDAYTNAQMEAIDEYWEGLSPRDKAEYCKDNGASIFAFRHDRMPEQVSEAFWQDERFY